jgi:hypothetical protein
MILPMALSRLYPLFEPRRETCRGVAWPAPGRAGACDSIPQHVENDPKRADSNRRSPPERKFRKISLTTRRSSTHITPRLLSCNGGGIVDHRTPQPHCHSTGSSPGICKLRSPPPQSFATLVAVPISSDGEERPPGLLRRPSQCPGHGRKVNIVNKKINYYEYIKYKI